MIAFLSIFFGLITGIKPVELTVAGAVAEVEVRLDGELVGVLREEPWRLECDFGRALATHELIAIARDDHGVELDRAVQLINVPRPPVETQILLDDWRAGGPRSARLIWQSVEVTEPSAVSVMLDGKVIADRYRERYDLPAVDPQAIHLLSARVEFPDDLFSTAEAAFGGIFGESTETELTAIPFLVADRKPRRVEQLQGRITKDGQALRVVAVDDGSAEVVIVRDHHAIQPLEFLGSEYHFRCGKYQYLALAKGDAFFVMSARSHLACHPDTGYLLFPISPPITHRDISLPWTLGTLKFDRRPVMPQRLNDAVATAGLRAAASQKRRAVVLAVNDCAAVSGQWSAQDVRRFLAQLQVPFRVWSVSLPGERPATATGGFCDSAEPIDSVVTYQAAIKRLRQDLLDQQVAWVEGRHLKRNIDFKGEATGARLAD